jgi:hypothetical protein
VHIYRPDEVKESHFGVTRVLNAYAYCETELDILPAVRQSIS